MFLFILFLISSVNSENIEEQCNINKDILRECDSNICVPKCCDHGKALFEDRVFKRKVCRKVDDIKEISNITIDYNAITVYKNHAQSNEKVLSEKKINDFKIIFNDKILNENCSRNYLKIDKQKSVDRYIIEDGRLVYVVIGEFVQLGYRSSQEYCFEQLVGWNLKKQKWATKYVYYAKTSIPIKDNYIYRGISVTLSAFFLLLTLIVYCLLKPLRNIQGMILMAYVSTCFVEYVIYAILIFGTETSVIKTGISCMITSSIYYYLVVSSFFWLNIMSLDIWWTFRGIRKVREIHRRGQRQKFMWYSAYAWGIPLVIAGAALALDIAGFNYRPGFDGCFKNEYTKRLYLFSLIGVTTIFNTVLFFMTIYNIWLMGRGMTAFQETNNQRNKQRFYLYLKVGSLMGVNWLLEFIGALGHFQIPIWVTYLTNAYNLFLGLILFIAFVCKRSVIEMLLERFNCNNRFASKYKNNKNSSVKTGETSKSTFRSTLSSKNRYSNNGDEEEGETEPLDT